MSVSKERRAELRDDIHDSIEAAFLGGDEAVDGQLAELSLYELRALLDLADERDRYRALLVEASHFNFGRDSDLRERIDAALEGKHD